MKKILTFAIAIMFGISLMAQNSIYDFTVKNQDGTMTSLKDYQGKVMLIVNTATDCGFTPHYYELEGLYEKFEKKGFVVLDFPCNQFGSQAPGTDEEIHQFCTSKYQISFPQFAKIDVNGENADPLYRWLVKQKPFAGFKLNDPVGKRMHEMLKKSDPKYAKKPDIKWNFTRFVVDQDGNVVARFEPTESFDETIKLIISLLGL